MFTTSDAKRTIAQNNKKPVNSMIITNDPEEGKRNLLIMLDEYCANILAYLDEPKAIFGSAVAMRKALEMLGAYLLYYHPRRSGNSKRGRLIKNGHDVFEGNASIKADDVAISGDYIKAMREIIFGISYVPGASETDQGVNGILHYQGYRNRGPQTTDVVENQHLCNSHLTFKRRINEFKRILGQVLESLGLHWNAYYSINELINFDDNSDRFEKVEQEIEKIAGAETQERFWLDYIGQTLNLFYGQLEREASSPPFSLLATDVIAACSRIIAEKDMFTILSDVKPDICFADGNYTLGDYIKLYPNKKPEKITEKDTTWSQRLVSINNIENITNSRVHWMDQDVDELRLIFATVSEGKSFRILMQTGLRLADVELMKDLIINEQPESIQIFIDTPTPVSQSNKVLKCIVAALVLLLVLIGGIYGYNQWLGRPIIQYFADYGWQKGELVGIGEMTKAEASGQGLHYRFVKQDGFLRRVEHVDGEGNIRDEYLRRDRPAVMKLLYDDDKLSAIDGYSSQDLERELYRLDFAGTWESTRTISFYHPTYQASQSESLFTLPLDVTDIDVYTWAEPYQVRTKIDSVTVTHISDNRVHISFARLDDDRTDSNHVSGMEYEYDSDGRIVEITYQYASGAVDANTLVRRTFIYDGYVLIGYKDYSNEKTLTNCKYDYDDNGLCIGIRYLNDMDVPVVGIAYVNYDYNADGQRTGLHYLSNSGEPVLSSEGFASQTWRFDEEGKLVEEAYFDDEKDLISLNGWAKRIFTYDGTKRLTSYFGTNSTAVNITDAGEDDYPYAKEQVERTDDVEVRIRYNDEGKRVLFPGDVFEWRYTYDGFGREIKVEAYGLNDRRVLAYGEYFSYQIDYDVNGRKIAQTWYELDGETPTRKNVHSYYEASNLQKETIRYTYDLQMKDFLHEFTISKTYDNSGNVVEAYCRDASDNLILHPDNGYAGYSIDYDENGHWIKAVYFDENMNPTIIPGKGYAIVQKDYNDNGNCIRTAYYNSEGELAIPAQYGYAVVESKYDETGRETEARYKNELEQLILHPQYEYAICRWEYDQDGHTTAVSFYGVNEEPIISPYYGFAKVCYEYDNTGREIEIRYYNESNELMINPKYGDARYTKRYDSNGNLVEDSHYDTEGKLIVSSQDGYAIKRSKYDTEGHETERAYYDKNEHLLIHFRNGYAVIRMAYDDAGHMIEEALYDDNDDLMIHEDYGCAIRRREYDDFGNLIKSTYYDTMGLSMIAERYGCAAMFSLYDEQGREIELRYLDEQGQLMINTSTGYAMVRTSYDEVGNKVEWRYYDENECLMIPEKAGAAIIRTEYDAMGNITWQSAYDTNNELMTREERGYATVIEEYDSIGRLTKWSYYDADGNVAISLIEGYATCQKEYDDNGNVIRFTICDADSHLMISPIYGYAMMESDYDENGHKIETRYYDANENLMIHDQDGYAVIRKEYDKNDNCISTAYYGTSKELIIPSQYGYAIVRSQYDEMGRETEARYLNEFEHLMLHPQYEYAICRWEYDQDGHTTVASFYGVHEEPIISPYYGFAKVCYEYDNAGREIEIRYYNESNELMINPKYGDAIYHKVYDDNGVLIEDSHFDTDHMLKHNQYDAFGQLYIQTVYHENGDYTVYQYDDDGFAEYWHHYDESGNLTAISDMGYAGGHYFYDEEGHTYAEEFYNEEDVLFLRRENDADGNALEWIQLDAQGNRMNSIAQ